MKGSLRDANKRTLLPPRLLFEDFQISVHQCSRILTRELRHVFPGCKRRSHHGGKGRGDEEEEAPPHRLHHEHIVAIPICQRARVDLVQMGEEVECEKDRLLNTFVTFGWSVAAKLIELGHWADLIDPCSALPMISKTNNAYSEVDGMESLLGYRCTTAGMCKVLLHPRWGSAVYPATVFTTAPFEVLSKILAEYSAGDNFVTFRREEESASSSTTAGRRSRMSSTSSSTTAGRRSRMSSTG